MIKQTVIAAGALAAAVFAFQPQEAQAGAKFHVHIGIPYAGYYDTHYYGRSHYRPYYGGSYHAPPVYRPRARYRVNCREARRILRHRGFRHIRARDCQGRRYTFEARRGGDWWIVRVNSRTGRIVRARPI